MLQETRRLQMNVYDMVQLKIGDLTAKLPIIQGGMGVGISLSGLAAAVANQGGIGVIAAARIGMFEHDCATNYCEANIRALREEIRKARSLTSGIIGVNIMVALSNFADLVKTSIEEGVNAIFAGAGLPLDLPGLVDKFSNTKLIPIISSAKAAKLIIKRWYSKYKYIPDAFVVEGPKAGGHLGFKTEQLDDPDYALEKIVVDVLNTVKPFEQEFNRPIPVIAGGGIYSGADIYQIMKLGVAGVQMATRFVTTNECDASVEFKNTYIHAKKEDIGIIQSPVGMPGRAIINEFIVEVKEGHKATFGCAYHCIVTCDYKDSPYCIARALINAKKGFLKNGFAFAGVNAYRATEIRPLQEVCDCIKAEYAQAVSNDLLRGVSD
jgi:NAD(P)H-dependent flavin oxidoreductase YrpB (nitropropane dioxygenase family)